MTVVLMYHALYEGECDLARISGLDRPYAVQVASFRAQLDLIQGAAHVVSPAEFHSGQSVASDSALTVLITFDDGHCSNYHYALPILLERQLQAAFFVTGDLLSRHRHYCTYSQIREMKAAGMWVQSHGHTHRFLSSLRDSELRDELSNSKSVIESVTGDTVVAISFPGGRFDKRTMDYGRKAGYKFFYGSRIGVAHGLASAAGAPVPRVAIRADTSMKFFQQLVSDSAKSLRYPRLIQLAKTAARCALGDETYHSLYRRLRA